MKKVGLLLFTVSGLFLASNVNAGQCKPGLNLERCSCPSGKSSGNHWYKKTGTTSVSKACSSAVNAAKSSLEKKYGAVTITSWKQTKYRKYSHTFKKDYAQCWINYNFSWHKILKAKVHTFYDTTRVSTLKGTAWGKKGGTTSVSKAQAKAKAAATAECAKRGKVLSVVYRENKWKKSDKVFSKYAQSWGTYECKYHARKTSNAYYCAP